jgi:hypothetical protein
MASSKNAQHIVLLRCNIKRFEAQCIQIMQPASGKQDVYGHLVMLAFKFFLLNIVFQ